MLMFPFMTLFLFTLLSSVIMAISASQWLFVWMALELNMLSFIPLMLQTSSSQETEAAIKYFLVQALGSSLLLMASNSLYMSQNFYSIISFSSILVMSSLLMKLGMAPFHFWFPAVMASLSWMLCLILSTIQKIIPMSLLLSKCSSNTHHILSLIIIISAMVGGIGGLNQTQLRPLLAYSSIGHMSWILAGAVYSTISSFVYFISYILVSSAMILFINQTSLFSNNMNSSITKQINLFWILFLILSLAGIPPFLGFIPKLLVLMSIPSLSALPFFLILGSLINLFYYMGIILSMMLKTSSTQAKTLHYKPMNLLPIIASLSSVLTAVVIYAMTMFNKP